MNPGHHPLLWSVLLGSKGAQISTELGAGRTELGADCHPIKKTWPLPGAGQDDGNMQKSPLMGSLREKERQHSVLEVYYFHIS